jgi:hypothetical protein
MRMKRVYLSILFIAVFSVCAYSQTAEEQLQVANARLVKTLDNLEAAERLIKTLETEIEARKRLETTNSQIIAAKDSVIEEQKKLIAILEKQSQRKLKIFWGIISVRF